MERYTMFMGQKTQCNEDTILPIESIDSTKSQSKSQGFFL